MSTKQSQPDLTITEGKQIFWNYCSILTGKLGSAVLGIVILTIKARLLQPEGYGILSLFLMVAGFISILLINWPSAAIIRFGREEFIRTGRIGEIFWARLFIFAITFIIGLFILCLFKDWIISYIGIEERFFYVIIFYILITSSSELVSYTLQATGKMKIFGFLPLIGSISNLVLLSLLLFDIIPVSVVNVIFCTIISQIIIILVAFPAFQIKYFSPLIILKSRIYQIVKYSWPLIFGAASAFIVGWIDLIVIKMYLSTANVGIYSLAYQGATFLLALVMSIIALTFPLITSLRTTDRIDLIKQYLDDLIPQGVLVWSIFLSGVIAVSGIFFPLVFGKSYQLAVVPFMILLIWISFSAIGCFYSGVMSAFDMIPMMTALGILVSVLNVAGDFLLIPKIGIVGAAIATTISISVGHVLRIPVTNKCKKLGSNLHRYLACVCAAPALITLIGCLLFTNPASQIAIFIFVSLSSIMVAKKTGLFKKETLDFIDFIDMPDFLKKGIIKVYRLLI